MKQFFKLKQSRQYATAEQLFSRCIDLTVDSFFAPPLLFGVICHRAIQWQHFFENDTIVIVFNSIIELGLFIYIQNKMIKNMSRIYLIDMILFALIG